MSDNEKDQNDAGDRNDHFLSNGRAIESSEDIHDGFAHGEARRTPQIMNATRSVKAAGISTGFRVLMRLLARGGISNLSLRFTRAYNCRPHGEQRRASDGFPGNAR